MKKWISLILCLLLAITFCACKQNDEVLEPVNFYYCAAEVSYNAADAVICAEEREGIFFQGEAQKMLHSYLEGPVSADLSSPLPQRTRLISFMADESTAYITLSNEFASLSGIKLSTACSCVTMTIAEYLPVTQVCFRVENGQIDNKDELIVSVSDIILIDHIDPKG